MHKPTISSSPLTTSTKHLVLSLLQGMLAAYGEEIVGWLSCAVTHVQC